MTHRLGISSFFEILHKYFFRISHYATTSINDSVFIIGGYTGRGRDITTIAEYKDGNWSIAGNLAQARSGHGAITFARSTGYMTMVLGGWPHWPESS